MSDKTTMPRSPQCCTHSYLKQHPLFLETNQPNWITNEKNHHPTWGTLISMGCQWLDSPVLCCCGPCPVSPVPALFWALMPLRTPVMLQETLLLPVTVLLLSLLQTHVPGNHSEIALSEKRLL